MKLRHIRIKGFRSVSAEVNLALDDRVTVLIGPNDHGKTNLLDAIRLLDPAAQITEDDANWDLGPDVQPRLEWHFELTEGESQLLGQMSEEYQGAILAEQSRLASGSHVAETPEKAEQEPPLGTEPVTSPDLGRPSIAEGVVTVAAAADPPTIPGSVSSTTTPAAPAAVEQPDTAPVGTVPIAVHASADVPTATTAEAREPDPSTTPISVPTPSTSPVTAHAPAPAPPPLPLPVGSPGELSFFREGVAGALQVLTVPTPLGASSAPAILRLLPKVELFSPLGPNLPDHVGREALESEPAMEFMQGIFRLAGIWDRRSEIFEPNDRTTRELDEASGQLTQVLHEQWNQGRDLNWKLSHRPRNSIQIQIRDPAVSTRYTRPSQKSSGFRSYFLLSMTILARTQAQDPQNFIFLFDEPGVFLHPKAQIDLLRSFEVISDRAQIIYTTHSLFLVNKNHPRRNIVVTKSVDGTTLNRKPFTGNWRALRDSLGLLANSNVLISDKTLVVEGPSDIIYLLLMIKALKTSGEVDIDLDDFSIIDAGDDSNMLAMVKLLASEGRNVVALCDGDKSGLLVKKRLIKATADGASEARVQAEALSPDQSIEDLIADVSLLDDAIHAVASDLIKLGLREPEPNLTAEVIADQHLAKKPGETLGATVRTLTSAWFADGDPISKLSVALKVEELIADGRLEPSAAGKKLVKDIKSWLGLVGERSHHVGVFEDVAGP